MKLTKAIADALVLPAGKTDHIEWDDDLPGFGVRLRGDARRWIVQYRVGRQQRRESLGDVRKVALDDARKIARARFANVELGVDPAAERAKANAKASTVLTLGKVADRYLDAKEERLAPSTYKQAKYHLDRLWQPLRPRPIGEIQRAEVAARLQELTKAHGRTAAARARGNLSAAFAWAMREGLTESNPTIGTNNPIAGVRSRERILNDAEIQTVWRACGGDDFGRIVRLLLLTGARREEIGRLKLSEINLDSGLMTIDGERTKNRRKLELLLPDMALAILRAVPRRDGCEHIFGRGRGPFSGWSAAKLRLDAEITIATGAPLAPWRLHDLRRTMRSGLGKLGVAPHVAELAINHVRGGIEEIYDKYRYQQEIGSALALWADHLASITTDAPRRVVKLRA